MTATVIDPRRVALTALAVVGDLTGVSLHFGNGGGAEISVHDGDVPFMARLLDLTGLTVSDASEPRPVRDRQVVVFERTPLAHLSGALSVDWFTDDGETALADLDDYKRLAGGAS